MLNRIYFLFPEPAQARRAVGLLRHLWVPESRIHAMAREGIDLSGLPRATEWQRRDIAAVIERVLWDINLGVFALFLLILAIALWGGGWGWALFSLAILAATSFGGYWFVSRVPRAHIDECRAAIDHGEVLLLVDLPLGRVHDVQNAVCQKHPEAEIGGVGWAMASLPV